MCKGVFVILYLQLFSFIEISCRLKVDNDLFKVQTANRMKINHRSNVLEHVTLQKPSRDVKAFYNFHNAFKNKCLFLLISNSSKVAF